MTDSISTQLTKLLFSQKGSLSKEQRATIILNEMIRQFDMDINILSDTYMENSGTRKDDLLDRPIQHNKKYRALTLEENILKNLKGYVQSVDQYIGLHPTVAYDKFSSLIHRIPSNSNEPNFSVINTLSGDTSFSYYLRYIMYTINAYFYQKNNPKAYLNVSEKPNDANVAALDKLSDEELDASWLTFVNLSESSSTLKKRTAHLEQYTKRGRTPPPQLIFKFTPIKPDPQTTVIANFIATQLFHMHAGVIDYMWNNYRAEPIFEKLIAYQNSVIDELNLWHIDSKSEREREIVKGWFGKEMKQNKKVNGKYVFKTNTGEPTISYEYFNKKTKSWEKKGILSRDQFKDEVEKHLLATTAIRFDNYYNQFLIPLIDQHFFTTIQSFGINGYMRQKPSPLMKYAGKNANGKNVYNKNKLTSHGINEKIYYATINGHKYGATVSRRYRNAPLSNREIPTRIGNRNYAITVKGGRKKSQRSRRY
uniref:Uncharacterized protein n=1 Tax=viral metagenome TaxID=1070528 RepID=A0A6C0KTA0_9ZZZZ